MTTEKPLSERTHTDEDGIRVATWENVAEAVDRLKKKLVNPTKYVCSCCYDNENIINEIFGDLK